MPVKGDKRYKSITINARAYKIFEDEADRRKLLRRTKLGELKPCLLKNDNLINIIEPIRNGASDKELKDLFEYAILKKEPYWRA